MFATLVKVTQARSRYDAEEETSVYFARDAFNVFFPKPGLAQREAILTDIALAWHQRVSTHSELQPILISRITKINENEYEVVYSDSITVYGTTRIEISQDKRNPHLTITLSHHETVPAQSIQIHEEKLNDYLTSAAGYDTKQRKTITANFAAPPIEPEPAPPPSPVIITASNWNLPANLAQLDKRFAAQSKHEKPSVSYQDIIAAQATITKQSNEAQAKLKPIEALLDESGNLYKDPTLTKLNSVYSDHVTAREEYILLKRKAQKFLHDDLHRATSSCHNKFNTLEFFLKQHDFGNTLALYDHIKHRLIHALYLAGRDYYQAIWEESKNKAAESFGPSPRVEFLRQKLGEFNSKFHPFIMVDDNYRLSPIDSAYKLDKMSLDELQPLIQNVLVNCNTTTGLSSRATLASVTRLKALKTSLETEFNTPFFTVPSRTDKEHFEFTKTALTLENDTKKTLDAITALPAITPANEFLLPDVAKDLSATHKKLKDAHKKTMAFRDLLTQKADLESRYRNIEKTIDTRSIKNAINEFSNTIQSAAWLTPGEKSTLDNHLNEKLTSLTTHHNQYKKLLNDIKNNGMTLSAILNMETGKPITLDEAQQAFDLVTEMELQFNEASELKKTLLAVDVTSLEKLFDQYARLEPFEGSLQNNILPNTLTDDEITRRQTKFKTDIDSLEKIKLTITENDNPANQALKSALNREVDRVKQKMTTQFHDQNAILLCHVAVSSLLHLEYWKKQTNFWQKRRTVSVSDGPEKITKFKIPPVIANLIDQTQSDTAWINDARKAKTLLRTIQQSDFSFKNVDFDRVTTNDLTSSLQTLPLKRNEAQKPHTIKHTDPSLRRFSVIAEKPPGFFKRHWKAMLIGGLLVAGAIAITIVTGGFGAPIGAGMVAAAGAIGLGISAAVGTGVGVGLAVAGGALIGVASGAMVGACHDYIEMKPLRQGYQHLEEGHVEPEPVANDDADQAIGGESNRPEERRNDEEKADSDTLVGELKSSSPIPITASMSSYQPFSDNTRQQSGSPTASSVVSTGSLSCSGSPNRHTFFFPETETMTHSRNTGLSPPSNGQRSSSLP